MKFCLILKENQIMINFDLLIEIHFDDDDFDDEAEVSDDDLDDLEGQMQKIFFHHFFDDDNLDFDEDRQEEKGDHKNEAIQK